MDAESTRAFREARYDEAAGILQKNVKEGSRDELLYLLDIALSLHSAGKWDEAIKVFRQADQLAEIKDYTSLSTEAGTLLVGENVKSYKGEDFENVLISAYLAMDYALLGQREDAIVEARRVNRKLQLMISEGQRKYKQNAFARYLSAILYEADGNFNDAYVDYREAQKLEPSFPGLDRDLWRMAWLLHMRDEMSRWDEVYSLTSQDHEAAKKLSPKSGLGEIIILYENGISPVKHPHPNWHKVPKFYPRSNPVTAAEVEVDGVSAGMTSSLYDIEKTAIENLDEKYAGIIAKRIAGVVAKEVVADQVERRTGSPLLGFITRVALSASDQADLRSWNLLPKDLQILRIPVAPGVHTVRVKPAGDSSRTVEKPVQVDGVGKRVFVNTRYMP